MNQIALEKNRSGHLYWIAILVMQLPFVIKHLLNMWQFRPHYEFFPVLMLACGWLFWVRWPQSPALPTVRSVRLSTGFLTVGVSLMLASLVFVSPWLAAVAFLINGAGIVIRLTGTDARQLLGPWLLCWLMVPPPFGIDMELVRQMQLLTASMVSKILEWQGVDHLLAGSVFQLSDRKLFVAEACSGVHSQLVLVAACLVWSVYRRLKLSSIGLLVAAACLWSLVVNVVRVTIVMLAAAKLDADISTGWIHELLGLTLVAAGLTLLLSTDQLIRAFASLVDQPDYGTQGGEEDTNVPMTDRFWFAILGRASNREPSAASNNWIPVVTRPIAVFCFLVAIVGSLQVVVVAGQRPRIRLLADTNSLGSDVLPNQIGAWALREYSQKHRERGSDEGEFSDVWRYVSPLAAAQISVDYPFFGWHELTKCYIGRGWKVLSESVIEPDSDSPMVRAVLIGPSGESGILIFSVFNSAGESMSCETQYWQNRVTQSPLVAAVRGESAYDCGESTTQIQLFAISDSEFDESVQQDLQSLFLSARSLVRKELGQGAHDDR